MLREKQSQNSLSRINLDADWQMEANLPYHYAQSKLITAVGLTFVQDFAGLNKDLDFISL